MQKYLVASVYRDQGDEGVPTFFDPQIVWGVSEKSACKAGRYPNSIDKEESCYIWWHEKQKVKKKSSLVLTD